MSVLKQEIRLCRARDGARIALATTGRGPPLLRTAHWLSHVEFDASSPVWAHWLRELSRDHMYIRYDQRGCGLSDWAPPTNSFEAWVDDLGTVVDSLGLQKFALLGMSQGGAIAIAYAARHPEKVSQLVLYGAYARGMLRRDIRYAAGPSDADYVALQWHREFRDREPETWNAFHTHRPATGLYLDEVPQIVVYARPGLPGAP